jgi:hypothetical protein
VRQIYPLAGLKSGQGEQTPMSSVKTHKVQAAWKKHALIDNDGYLKMYKQSVKDPSRSSGSRMASPTSATTASTGT